MHHEEARTLARASLQDFGLSADSDITFVKYRENHVFRVEDPNGEAFALKLHRPGYRTDQEIQTELRYLQTLDDHGIPVPRVRPTADGGLYATVSQGSHTRRASMITWLHDARPSGDTGEAFAGHDSTTTQDFAEVGTLLANLHSTAEDLGSLPGFQRGAWDADGLAGPTPLWGDPRELPSLEETHRRLLTATLPKLRSDLSALGTGSRIFGMVHADATPENVLRTAEGLVLIDFDDFGTGWYLFDLATALFHHTRQPRYPELQHALLTSYEAVRPLTEAEHAAWDALILARGLSYLGWAAERTGDEAAAFVAEHVAPWVLTLAEAYMHDEPAPYGTAGHRLEETS